MNRKEKTKKKKAEEEEKEKGGGEEEEGEEEEEEEERGRKNGEKAVDVGKGKVYRMTCRRPLRILVVPTKCVTDF